MDHDFWHNHWFTNQIGFHEPAANPLLVKHIDKLNLPEGSRIFLPLCGKTLDIAWLLSKGHQVVGAELSKLAVDQLFKELCIQPIITRKGSIDFVGDIFDVTPAMLGKVDAIYDRAALVALPPDMRKRYTRHLMELTNAAPQLLICFEYDQSLVDGPPFLVAADVVKAHYADQYELKLLENVSTKLKGQFEAMEVVWLLDTSFA